MTAASRVTLLTVARLASEFMRADKARHLAEFTDHPFEAWVAYLDARRRLFGFLEGLANSGELT